MKRSNRLIYLAYLCLGIGYRSTFKKLQLVSNETPYPAEILTSRDMDRIEHFVKRSQKLFALANIARQEEKFWGEAA